MNWVTEEFIFSDVSNEYVSINTPFVDSLHDNIEIFARTAGNDIILTDLGETVFNLESQGYFFDNPKSKNYKLLHSIIKDFGVNITEDDSLMIKTPLQDFPNAKIRLLQTILRLNDIPYLIKNNHGTKFTDTVRKLLEDWELPFVDTINIQANKINPQFDFAISNFKNIHSKLVRAVAQPGSILQAKAFYYDVKEVQEMGRNDHFILLTDSKNKPDKLESFQLVTTELKDTVVVDISDRDDAIQKLSA